MITQNRKPLWLLSFILALSLLIAACGDDQQAPAAVDGAATPTAVVAQQPAVPTDTPVTTAEEGAEPAETDTLTDTTGMTETVGVTETADGEATTLTTQDVQVITGTQLITGTEITTDVIVTTETVVLQQQLITTVITATDIVTDVVRMTDQATETESEFITETVRLTPETETGAAAAAVALTPFTPTPSPTVVVELTRVVTATEVVTETVPTTVTATPPPRTPTPTPTVVVQVTEVVTGTQVVTETVQITATATPQAGRTPTPAARQTVTSTAATTVTMVFVGVEGATNNQFRASTLLGYNFQNRDGEVSGEVEDLLIDITNGRVIYALLAYGGFLNIGDNQVAAPLSALAWGPGDELVLSFDEAQLENLPELDSDWPNFGDASWDDALSDFWQGLGFETGSDIEEVANNIVRASDLIGYPVNDIGYPNGTLEDMIVDLGEGRVKYLLFSFADTAGFGNQWVAVPFSAFDAAIADNQLTFAPDFNPAVLNRSPRINPNLLGQNDLLDPTVDEVLTDYWEGAGYPTTVENEGEQAGSN